jgi:hypothetical protein
MTLFAFVVFLSAFLLFQVQLIVSKYLLPWFGGTPAVWTTSQMFFQVLLLGGYAYAHALTRIDRPRTESRIHVAVLLGATAAVFSLLSSGGQPLLAPEFLKPSGQEQPILFLLAILAVSVGLPFFAVATTGPLLQRWHSRQSASLSRTYRLYAVSNIGSFVGLLSYPVVIERLLSLPQQAWLWALVFLLFTAGCSLLAWRTGEYGQSVHPASAAPQAAHEISGGPEAAETRSSWTFAWLFLSAASSVMFLATTNQLAQEVAAVPFLWVLPLAIYLLTFIICFERPAWYSRRWISTAAATTCLAVLPIPTGRLPIETQVIFYCAFLFCFCMLCHGELVRLRPGAKRLTMFYLVIASGGAIGGIFVSIVAPAVFRDLWELYVGIVLGWLCVGFVWWTDPSSPFHTGDRWFFTAVVAIGALAGLRYVIERTGLGSTVGPVGHGWSATFAAAAVITTSVAAVLWKTKFVRQPLWPQALVVGVTVLSTIVLLERAQRSRDLTLYAARNFYGVIRVVNLTNSAGEARGLIHGTTSHGVQVNVPTYRKTPTAYYSRSSGISLAYTGLVRTARTDGKPEHGIHFGIIGMGVGTMSAFAESTDRVRYYEINPEVIEVAHGQTPYFTFIHDSASEVAIVRGDARLSLERELVQNGSQRFDLLAMDAFSSDSVPVHLVSEEAFRVYAAHMNSDRSILAVNVTNRYLDLEPVIAANALTLGFYALRFDSSGDPPVPTPSSWILLSRDPTVFAHPEMSSGRPLRSRLVRFTDNYSNLFRVLK